ncbi:MAG: serine protease [Bacteroidales bacterium]|nr:serine protease [Bacteroidales bacterium]
MGIGFVVILIIVGVLLLLAELLIVPGVGVAGILGLCSLIASCVYCFYHFSLTVCTVVIAINVLLVVVFTVFVLRGKTWKRLSLSAKIDNSVASGQRLLAVGDVGKTTTRLAPMGSARFDGEVYEVKSLEGMVSSGVEVEVVYLEDNKVVVKPKV